MLIKKSTEPEKICLSSCPVNKSYNTNFLCSSSCKKGEISDKKSCVTKCPVERKYELLKNNKLECSDTCEGKYYSSDNNSCVSVCNKGELLDTNNSKKSCVTKCPVERKYGLLKNNKLECSDTCEGKYYSSDNNSCVSVCNKGELLDTNNSKKSCVTKCPVERKYGLLKNNKLECSDTCEGKYYSSDNNSCVSVCNKGELLDTNNSKKSCVTKCPVERKYGLLKNNILECSDKCKGTNLPYIAVIIIFIFI